MSKLKRNLDTLHELHRNGELELARKGYQAILRKYPNEITALHALGIIHAQQDRFSEAIEYFQTAIKQQPNDPSIYLHLANALKVQGLFSQAADVLQHTLQRYPNYPLALNTLGTVYYAQGKLSDAIQSYRAAIAKKSDYIDAYYNLGLALTKQEAFADAIDTYETLLAHAPQHIAARFHLACVLMRKEQFSRAILEFLEIEKHQPHHFETQTNLATCYLRQGNFNAAKMHYENALALSPKDTQILFNLGFINMQQGHIDAAIQYYQQAAILNPNDFAAHNNLGVIFLAKQHIGLALQHFREALRIQPNNGAITYTVKMLSQQERLLAAPPDYVESLFDAYADHYEPHLLMALDYQLPQLLKHAVDKVKKPNSWDILDVGCGTGLCGALFKSHAKRLVGVDISKKMLDVAAQKNIYDELHIADLTTFLAKHNSTYDLILAGDVFVYMGDLSSIFASARAALRKGGMLTFNAEINEKSEFNMNQSGRFSHQKTYLDALAKEHHFEIAYYDVVVTRMQNNEPLKGHLYVLVAIVS